MRLLPTSPCLRSALSMALFAVLVPIPALAQDAPTHAGWISLAPPLIAIGMALWIRQVIPALFVGLWFGAWAAEGLSVQGLFTGLLDTGQEFVLPSLAKPDHAAVLLFSMLIGGMVGIISRNGGMQGVVNAIVAWADNARHACIATATMGLAVFFDDYANTLVVGNTMRPVTDRLRVSREKLAYIVDSTAAPVSCIALVTTWIGYEVGLIDDALNKVAAEGVDAYAVFLGSIPYSFYPLLAIAFVFMIVLSGRDFGAMLVAERRARATGQVESLASEAARDSGVHEPPIEPIEEKPHRALNAILPVLTLVVAVVVGLLVTGGGEGRSLREIIGAADSYKSLLWASLLGVMVAAILSLVQRVLSLTEIVDAWFRGVRSMFYAMIILVLAWSLSAVTDELGTANYLVDLLGERLNPAILPVLVFLMSAATAFATGSSWGTMGILMPLVVPLSWAIISTSGDPATSPILFSTISCVLAGAVWGDHCSPISDTTILSSMASGCDHIEHVRTQLPYALLVGMVALVAGTLPTGFGVPWWLSLLVSLILLGGFLKIAGQPSEEPS